MRDKNWLMKALREDLENRDMSDLSPFERDFTQRLINALDEPVQRSDTVSLQEDALAVLGDAKDDVLEDIIERLDTLVTRAKSGGVILSESESQGSVWDRILADQLKARVRELQRKSNGDSDVYRQLFGAKSETRHEQDTRQYSDRFGQ